MAKKKMPADKFREQLDRLSQSIAAELRLPSLAENRLEGYAYLFRTAEVYANPIEAANQFFAGLKPILKTAGHIEQQEILISRTECRLM